MRNCFAENNSFLAIGITLSKLVGPNAQRSAAWPVDFEQIAFDYFMRFIEKPPTMTPARRPGQLQRRVGRPSKQHFSILMDPLYLLCFLGDLSNLLYNESHPFHCRQHYFHPKFATFLLIHNFIYNESLI